MELLRSKPLLSFILFLAVILQGLTPFIHAHTGASTQIGLHMHVAGAESATSFDGKPASASMSSEESPEVGVPTSRQSDHFDFDLPDLLSFVFLLFPLMVVLFYQNISPIGLGFIARRNQAQNSLPPALAPPYSL